jgi:processive 1,2-diacylglycerol beta-glucosyltransferase
LPRILFLSAAVGVGHTAAANAVRDALLARDPSLETETVDSYQYAASIFAKIVADGYIGMIKTVPQVYAYLYGRVERARNVPAARRFVNRYTAANLRAFVERMRPDLVVCTHAFPCGVMSEYKRQFDPHLPVVGIVTDFVVHPFWIYPNVDAYAVATEDMRRELTRRGVAPERILVSGIPVDMRYGAIPADREALRRKLGLPHGRHIVLIMGGGVGIGPLDKMMRALGRVEVPIAAAVIVGRNRRLEKRVLAAAERTPYPLRVFRFVDNVFDYMHASDVLLSKPGGLTSSEALAARLPMILVRPLPGPEERNTRYLVESGAAIRTNNESDLAAAVQDMLTSEPCRAARAARVDAVRRPDAAVRVAERIADLLVSRARGTVLSQGLSTLGG